MLKKIKNIQFIAKGHRGAVYSGFLNGKKVALKIKDPKSKAICRMENEANILKIINKKSIGPKLIFGGKDFLVMEFVEGEKIHGFLRKAEKKEIIKILKKILNQCYILDKLLIDKKEMTNPYKHILVKKNLEKPIMIDFERAKKDLKPSNVTGFCSFLTSKSVSDILFKKKIKIDEKKLIELCKLYKKAATDKESKKIFGMILEQIK